MKMFIMILLIITLAVLIALYILLRKELTNIASQLNKINRTKTNSKVLISTWDKSVQMLALEVNKTLEERQRTEAEYKRIDMELRQAIANISHDLRTPLTSIMGYMQLMEDNNLSEEERKQYIEIVDKRAKDLQILISSFYDLSRLEANEYNFELTSINLTNILLDIIASFYNDFLSKGIEPAIDIDEKAAMIIADKNAVSRIFLNLIQNMIKYGENSVEISLKQHKNYITTVFRNGAPDLTEEDVVRLFERSFTADRTRSSNSTGLGLAITKQLVEQMGYTIFAELLDGMLTVTIRWVKDGT